MIPFDEIDSRLAGIGKTRSWLAEITGRKQSSIGDALAPAATPLKRSGLLQKALTDAIEGEERRQREAARNGDDTNDRVVLEPTKSEFNSWCHAYKHSGFDTLHDWIVYAANKAAEKEAKEIREKNMENGKIA